MVWYGEYNFLNFCLSSLLIVCCCLQSEARFVYRDTVDNLITTSKVNNDTELDSKQTNNTNVNDDRQSKTDKLNASAITVEQDFSRKKSGQSSSSSTVIGGENVEKENTTQLSNVRNPEYNNERGQEGKIKLEQTQQTTLTSPPEKRPNGLENDIDDPNDVTTHVKPCEPNDVSCSSDQDKSDNSGKTPVDYSRLGTGYSQDETGKISLPDSNQVLGDDRYNKDKKRMTEISDDAENDDAYF